MTPLASLLAAVECGKPKLNEFKYGFTGKNCFQAHKAFYGSTDAAIALCEAMLPGWGWSLDWRDDGFVSAWLTQNLNRMTPKEVKTAKLYDCREYGISLARALFIATLRALVAMEGTP